MPSTYTPLLRLTLPADGELVGTWGQTVNNGITSLEEAAIAGTVAVPVTDGADTVLTIANGAADQARFNTLRLTGALTAQRNVIVPAASKNYFVRNATTGGFGVLVKTAGGAGVVVPAGAAMLVYCDGVDVMQATSGGSVTVGDINGTPDLILKASGTEYMRITAAGFVAIGPSNLQSVLNVDRNQDLNTTLRIGNSSAGASSATELRLANSASATALFMNGASSANQLGPNSAALINSSSNGVLAFGTNGVERMRINAAGNVGIGLSALNFAFAGRTFLEINGTSSSILGLSVAGAPVSYLLSSAASFSVVASTAIPLILSTNAAERMRITPQGAVTIGVAAPYANDGGCLSLTNVGTTDAPLFMRNQFAPAGQFWKTGPTSTQAYVIYNDSNIGVYMGYGGSSWSANPSDERRKTDFVEFADAVDKVASLRSGTGRIIGDETNQRRSFLMAQDVQAVLPEAVSVAPGTEDTLGLCYTDVIPLLVAAIKELNLRLVALGG